MASTFQLGDEQPSLKPTNLTKAAANSFNNLFGPPAPAKVDDDGDDSGDDDGDDSGDDDGDDDGGDDGGDDEKRSHQLLRQPLWSIFGGGRISNFHTLAKVFISEGGEVFNPTPAKVAPVVSSALKSGDKQSKVAPAGLVGEVSSMAYIKH